MDTGERNGGLGEHKAASFASLGHIEDDDDLAYHLDNNDLENNNNNNNNITKKEEEERDLFFRANRGASSARTTHSWNIPLAGALGSFGGLRETNYQTMNDNADNPANDDNNMFVIDEASTTKIREPLITAGVFLGDEKKRNALRTRGLRAVRSASLPAKTLRRALKNVTGGGSSDDDDDDLSEARVGFDGNFYNMFTTVPTSEKSKASTDRSTTVSTDDNRTTDDGDFTEIDNNFDQDEILTKSSNRAALSRPAHPSECVLPPCHIDHSKPFLFWVRIATNLDGMTLPPKLLMNAYLGWYLAVMVLLPNKSVGPFINGALIAFLVGLVLNANAFASYKTAFYACKRAGGRSNLKPTLMTYLTRQSWSVFRLVFIPFAVSSYSAAAGAAPDDFFMVFPSKMNILLPAITTSILLPLFLVVLREIAWVLAENEEEKEYFLQQRLSKRNLEVT